MDIGPNTKLPALREHVVLRTEDGLDLVGELAVPIDRAPIATVVLLHPLPTGGGNMDSHLLRKAAYRLPELAGLAVLRFNTRGTASEAGRSTGSFDNGVGERHDVEAAIAFAADRGLPDIWLVGWSFGTDLGLMHGHDPRVRGLVLLAPPLRMARQEHLDAWAGRRVVCVVPEFDDYLRPAEATERLGSVAEVHALTGAKHLFVGHTEAALDFVVATVAPQVPTPLPSRWS